MSGRIMSLDPAARARLGWYATTWADRTLNPEPVDWRRWEMGVTSVYMSRGLSLPAVVRTASPLALARALFLARVTETPGDERRALIGVVRLAQRRINGTLRKLFDRPILAQVEREVSAPLDAVLRGDAVVAAVEEQLRDAALDQDPTNTRASARAAAVQIRPDGRLSRTATTPLTWQSWRLHLGGEWEGAWCAYASFLAEVARFERHGLRGRLTAFVNAQSAGWWFPHQHFVLASDRPVVVRTEDSIGAPGRLHCADGPALAWRDGWRLYFWHGTRVPAWVVENPTLEAIHAESNVEVRRCAIEAMGWDAYLGQAGLGLVDTAADPGNPGFELRLYHVPAEVWGSPARVLLATNGSAERDGTRRRYGLPVPADMDTALNAAAWTYGLTGGEYAGLIRRS